MIRIPGFCSRNCSITTSNYYTFGVVPRVFSFCTQTPDPSTTDELLKWISTVGPPRETIFPILNRWADEGRSVNPTHLKDVFTRLWNIRRYTQALQLVEWMSDRPSLQLSSEDFAVMLNLTERVRVMKDAEKYLNNTPDTMNKFSVYCDLLRGYARNRLLHKSEEVMQRLREMNYRKPFAYNLMMGLYSHMGIYKKIEALLREMEEKQINGGKATFLMQLDVYASNGNIEGMNKLLHEKKNYPEISENWKVFEMLAKGYLKAGQAEKSSEMLREIEKRIGRYPSAYRTLVSMYADLGDIEEVYRVWNLTKNEINIRNIDYYNMISSLVTLDDFDGAEEILKEWESSNKIYDFRILRFLIEGYVKKGFLEKAEELVRKVIVSGNKPPASIWGLMATGYSKSGRMDKALDAMTEAILSDQDCWTPNCDALKACLGYLKKKGEDELVEGLFNLLSERRILSRKSIEVIRYEVEVSLIKLA